MITFTVSSDAFLIGLSLIVLETMVVCYMFVRIFTKRRAKRVTLTEQSDAIFTLEKQLAKSQHQLKELIVQHNKRSNYINSMFASMEDGVLVVSSEFEVLLVNPAGRKYLEVNNEIFFRKGEWCEQSALFKLALQTCKEVLTSLESSVSVAHQNNRYFEIKTSIIYNQYAKSEIIGVLALVKDITEIRKAEALRKEFVANVSHEFRTPMTLISGFIEMLKFNDGVTEEERKRALDIIEIESERLKRLISELLTLSEIESTLNNQDQAYIDVEDIIEQCLMALSPLSSQKEIEVSCKISLEYPLLMGNENFFYQAVFNVVENAIKYTPVHGAIALNAFVRDQNICILVKDNGIGIPQAELERIFERFYRVDPTRSSHSGGSGIGLAIVKNIMVMFQGEVKVESDMGVGTTFTLCFPVTES